MLDWAQWKQEAIGSAATKVEERGLSAHAAWSGPVRWVGSWQWWTVRRRGDKTQLRGFDKQRDNTVSPAAWAQQAEQGSKDPRYCVTLFLGRYE